MTALALRSSLVDTVDQLFEPIEFKTLAQLFEEHEVDRKRMEAIASVFDEEHAGLIEFFLKANSGDNVSSPKHLFKLEPALKALDASYWQRALDLTDILELMPQSRRGAWHEDIKEFKTPPFERSSVILTLQSLFALRPRFFAERVDGIFNSLSPEHVTNRPEGFSKRMILTYVYSDYVDSQRCGIIHDLRCVIAKFMGREDPRWFETSDLIKYARLERRGAWVTVDGGALRIKLFIKGTAHLEVHPEIAWRLNATLASIHPNVIPEGHRTRARTKQAAPKDFKLYNRPLPTAVLGLLIEGTRARKTYSFSFHYSARTSHAYREAKDVLAILGGVEVNGTFEFDYDYEEVLSEVCFSGVIPDQRVHQYYPTPREIAQYLIEVACINDHDTVLEPSAGQGAIAELLPKSRTTLVEVAPLHCEILRAKGFLDVIQTDFLAWKPGRRFDRIVMNPPFKGLWLRHLEHACSLLAAGGRLVAVLPAGAVRRTNLLPGWSCTWSEPVPFPGTSIEVVVLVAERGA